MSNKFKGYDETNMHMMPSALRREYEKKEKILPLVIVSVYALPVIFLIISSIV